MKSIKIKELKLKNFKGIKDKTIDLDDSQSIDIYGANGSGKTTIFDAFLWLLFGKNSEDKKDFEIKRLDNTGKAIEKIEVEVSAIVLVGFEEVAIRKILKEKWVKQKASLESEFTGNETLYYWNEVPMTMKEFQNKVSFILDDQVFKLITSPTAFNSLKWQERRNVLIEIVGHISEKELARGNDEYENLVNQLSNKTLDEYKKQIAASIKKAKEDIKTIPTRVDEVERGKPLVVDVTEFQKGIDFRLKEIEAIDKQLQDKSAANETILNAKIEHQTKIFEFKKRANEIEFEIKEKAKLESKSENSKAENIRTEIQKNESDINTAKNGVNSLLAKKGTILLELKTLDQRMEALRADWFAVNGEVFSVKESDCNCPMCGKELDDSESKKQSLNDAFQKIKLEKLKHIETVGANLKKEKENLTIEEKELTSRIEKGDDYVADLNTKTNKLRGDLLIENNKPKINSFDDLVVKMLLENTDYQNINEQIKFGESVEFETITVDNFNELSSTKQKIQSEIDNLKTRLSDNTRIEEANKRINDLLLEEKKLAQQIANFEKTQFTIENFTKLKIDTIETKINDQFDFVKFKLFETQINGAEVECCDALINGVPFSDANTASKINAGIDIINSLCKFYKVSAPIFIDNRESVTDLIPSESQIINLIVSAADTKLRIEAEKRQLELV